MTLEKAIELNTDSVRSLKDHKFPDHSDALQLGIEALKFRLHCEHCRLPFLYEPLPGETQDLPPKKQ